MVTKMTKHCSDISLTLENGGENVIKFVLSCPPHQLYFSQTRRVEKVATVKNCTHFTECAVTYGKPGNLALRAKANHNVHFSFELKVLHVGQTVRAKALLAKLLSSPSCTGFAT
jgi:hypothetical protein